MCLGQISPSDLVRMRSEQYASDELAEWREKTLKKVFIYFVRTFLTFFLFVEVAYFLQIFVVCERVFGCFCSLKGHIFEKLYILA